EPSLLVWGSKTIVGVIQYDPWVIPRALDFLVRNRTRWPFDRLLSHKYPLEKIDQAFADSEWHNRQTTAITRAALVPSFHSKRAWTAPLRDLALVPSFLEGRSY